ncbi:GTPase [Desulfatiglans anilini]|uniref:GTPase n=1 Tax=Desulfatiglans anilini TaxID=90728 RepID=UPI00040EC436|nr:GTPase [Desulfatiglans anilini]
MRDPGFQVRKELDRIDRLLEKDTLFSIAPGERRSLAARSKALRAKLERIEGRFLTVGLIGGTGVGKSSLLNALAGSEIASSSHRRPHTDRVLIYRHIHADPPPAAELRRIPWKEITHEAGAMQALLLCDLPDFDSLGGENRRYVVDFLEHLDLLVWVASPEKYADGRFYAFLDEVPKAREYFAFVLNKVDQLVEPGDGAAADRLAPVLSGFKELLAKHGVPDPLVFAVSAEHARRSGGAAVWNQFDFFRRHLIDQQRVKTITAIKAANLSAEIQQLLTPFETERLHLEEASGVIANALQWVEEKRSHWTAAGREALSAWLISETAPVGEEPIEDLSGLVGPSYGIGLLLQTLRRGGGNPAGGDARPNFLLPPEGTAAILRRPFQWLEENLHSRFLRANLPQSLWEEVQSKLDLEGAFEQLGTDLATVGEQAAAQAGRPSFRIFRAGQMLTFAALTLCLLIALTGAGAWRAFFEHPGLGGAAGLLAAAIEAVFSPKGLAALLSYALINLFLSIRFYRRYNKKRRDERLKRRVRLAETLAAVWSEHLGHLAGRLQRLEKDTREQIGALESVLAGRRAEKGS